MTLGLLLFLGMIAAQEVPAAPYSPVPAGAAQTPAPLPPLPPPPVVDPAHPPKVIERPVWAQKPTGEAVSRVFPDRAMRLAIPGRAVVECQVRLTGVLEGCSIVEETPAGMGFGDAVLRLSRSFRMTPLRHDGVAVDGGVVKIPINFRTPDEPPWQGEFIVDQAVACVRWHRARLEVLPGDAESVRGVEHFSAMARRLGPRTGVSANDIEAALGGAAVAALLDLPSPSSLCRLAV